MNICIFSLSFAPEIGGLERIAGLLAEGFSDLGHKVTVVTSTMQETDGDRTHARRDERPGYMIVRARQISEWAREFSTSDISLHMNVSLPGCVAAYMSRKPCMFVHHSAYALESLGQAPKQVIRKVIARMAPGIAVSAYVAKRIGGYCKVIPNSYDDVLFRSEPNAPKTYDFVLCGRLVSEKGFDLGLRAFASLVRDWPSATLSVIGSGPEDQRLRHLAQELQMKVRFLGALRGTDLVRALEQHRCMIVPSVYEEPFGVVALEGLCCCGDVIVSARGGLPEAGGATASICQPTVPALARAMDEMLRRPQRSEAAELLRRAHLEEHRAATMVRRYEQAIETHLASLGS